MNVQIPLRESFAAQVGAPLERSQVVAAAEAATRRIAPVWPLKDFVAVNPFVGLSGESFTHAGEHMIRAAGAQTIMDRPFFLEQYRSGRITDEDLAGALALHRNSLGLVYNVEMLKEALYQPQSVPTQKIPLVTDVATEVTGTNWSSIFRDRMAHWAASYFDDGQALWGEVRRSQSVYQSFKSYASVDQTPPLLGAKGFCKAIAALPDAPEEALDMYADVLGLGQRALEDHFHALLMACSGWASLARYRLWQAELKGGDDETLIHFLAALAGWELALRAALESSFDITREWHRAYARMAAEPRPDLRIDAALQSAYELAWQRQCVAELEATLPTTAKKPKPYQVAFCIDVRSEVFRRALECTSSAIETIGFAGFFGVPLNHLPAGEDEGADQCPVLLNPAYTIKDTEEDPQRWGPGDRQRLKRAAKRSWKSFKISAVSSFAFVETFGWSYAAKLATDALGLTRPVRGLSRPELSPCLTHSHDGTGIPAEDRINLAENILRGMSLTNRLGRLILLAGHGASVVNNPHAAGLECGACGGHSGDVNARVAAAILNDPDVRVALVDRDITIPEHTHFIAGLHDTTTDEVRLYDEALVPASHVVDLAKLKTLLAKAGETTRADRAQSLGLMKGPKLKGQIDRRSRDWSQVRPEWGLAGCAAFIAAPRERTAATDLDGRAFLHCYDWKADKDNAVLELIMTAPMVVASWISLQYYGSTVDNRAFGAGNKVLHNVVGTFGVLEGAGGDLRTGLPLQSVHDGEKLVHEPLRLSVFLAAPTEAIDGIIARHKMVRDLVSNGWLHLFAMGEADEPILRWSADRRWTPAIPVAPQLRIVEDGKTTISTNNTDEPGRDPMMPAQDLSVSEPTAIDHIEWVMDHPGMSPWIKSAIEASEGVDPNTLLNEVEVLAFVLRKKAETEIEEALAAYSNK